MSEIRKGSVLLRSCGDQHFVLMTVIAVYNLGGEKLYLSLRFQRFAPWTAAPSVMHHDGRSICKVRQQGELKEGTRV